MNAGLREKCIDLYQKGYSYSDIAQKLGCTKGTLSYHLSSLVKEKNRSKREQKEMLIENIKKEPLTRQQFIERYSKFLTVKENKKLIRELFPQDYRKRKNTIVPFLIKSGHVPSVYHSERRRKIKKQLIDFKGGKCQICGYDKCLRALEFHHVDASEKDFNISANIKKMSLDRIKNELNKCVLLCSNCHKEVHDGLVEITLL